MLLYPRITHDENYVLATSLLCYQCVSTHPGCGTPFQWIWYSSISCPEDDDVCVKVIETKDGQFISTRNNEYVLRSSSSFLFVTCSRFTGQDVITRDCLSSIKGIRTDIPADHYEGCRSSTIDWKLANYVNNSIKEIDVKR